jgi:hypothetical protein
MVQHQPDRWEGISEENSASQAVRFVGLLEQDIPVDPHLEAVSDSYFDSWLDVEIPARGLSAYLRHVLSDGLSGELLSARITEHVAPAIDGDLSRGGKETGQRAHAEEASAVVVHLVAESGHAFAVLPGHGIEHNGRAVWEHDTVPDDLDAILAAADFRRIVAN